MASTARFQSRAAFWCAVRWWRMKLSSRIAAPKRSNTAWSTASGGVPCPEQ
jgi:hypothetical protein